jgi:peptidoglycan/LPS O-acetylase OafA/YrhL
LKGLRGLASILVINSHLAFTYSHYFRTSPALSENGVSSILQLPIINNLKTGRPSIACFAVISGFVTSLKPLRLIRQDRHDEAIRELCLSAFRRSGKLILPAMLVTIVSWVLCQLGAFEVGRNADSLWLRRTAPPKSTGNVFIEVQRLLSAIWTNWTTGSNPYDKVLWSLPWFLKGSFRVYTILSVTLYASPSSRLMMLSLFYVYLWCTNDCE